MYLRTYFCVIWLGLVFTSAFGIQETMKYTQTAGNKSALTPLQALTMLKEGNNHFLTGQMQHRNYINQAKLTSKLGQAPFAVILSCMDSRGPVEIILDQGIGDIFSLRVAGNVLNEDILGSMEFGTKVVGAKLLVVMGHTQCGAVAGACEATQLGNLTGVLNKIKPAVDIVFGSNKRSCDPLTVDTIARQNVIDMIKDLRNRSPIINELAQANNVLIVGAMHDLRTGRVTFFDENGKNL